MKKNIISLSLILLGLFVFAACDDVEGELYQGEDNKVSFVASTTNLDMTGDYLKVPIGRTSTDGSLTVPVTLTSTLPGYTDAFKVVADVEFTSGESKAYVNVDYSNFGSVDPTTFTIIPDGFDVGVGLGFPFKLNIQESLLSPTKRGTVNITALNELEFKSAGVGSINGNWDGKIENVTYEKAIGIDAYKVISPYSNYNFAFLINSDGVSVNFPQQQVDVHPLGPVFLGIKEAHYDSELHAVVADIEDYLVRNEDGDWLTAGPGIEIFYLPK